ncbi:tetratricopeptide repeat protein 8 [Anthonomus grandis grandis]|uniref:tetratricopeptide repeat protein 8 n=1 Tax=Anthonomus grandis grandis TaxID=2921223 RepID=UPI002166A7C5|nr:tetratricopeptide repeat protein 8 [Anthonomus grandis grandis]
MDKMEPLYVALSLFRRRHYEKCIEVCTSILEKQPLDQTAWCLKMRAMTQRVYVDDLESEEAPTEDNFLDSNVVATAPRPGTSLKVRTSVVPVTSLGARPRTSTGRPISGVIRPGTQSSGSGSAIERLRMSRGATGQSARAVRLGTAAMLSQKDGPFIEISRLNLSKYSKHKGLSKPLFEYLFYHEGDIRNAMELTVLATQACEFKDWWWKIQLSKCYTALNLIRDAEQQIKSAIKQHPHVESYIRLIRIYLRLDQPLTATEVSKRALEVFPNDVSLMTEQARISEALNESQTSVKLYRSIVIEDAMNTEAIACIGMYHFYNNQPELALRYYRRVLAMGAHSPELYNNLGLCCLYSQQLDLTLACFQRALDLATDPLIKADIWYNLSHVAIAAGDIALAIQCLSVCLSANSMHAEAFNNLAVLQHKTGNIHLARAYLTSAERVHQPMALPETIANINMLMNI